MTKHRSHSATSERQVADEFVSGETLHALASRGLNAPRYFGGVRAEFLPKPGVPDPA